MRHHLVLRVVTKLLMGPIMLFALYVQFHGDFGAGGGFQAGVIFASAFVLYAIVFGLDAARRAAPDRVVKLLMSVGAMLYVGTGVLTLVLGARFLDYDALAHHPSHGQHWGILLVEGGVGVAVASTMIAIFYAFAARPPVLRDEDW